MKTSTFVFYPRSNTFSVMHTACKFGGTFLYFSLLLSSADISLNSTVSWLSSFSSRKTYFGLNKNERARRHSEKVSKGKEGEREREMKAWRSKKLCPFSFLPISSMRMSFSRSREKKRHRKKKRGESETKLKATKKETATQKHGTTAGRGWKKK